MTKIGFIGMGNMGYAFAKGLLSEYDPEDLMFSCRTEEKKQKVFSELGIMAAGSNSELVHASDIIVLAVKPQMYDEVFEDIRDVVRDGMIFISLAPGVTTGYIRSALGGKPRVVRAMPNTPALIGYGVTGIAYDDDAFSPEEIKVIDQIFSSVGSFEKVAEDKISAVVCASGSSPAYVYMFIDALAKACASKGIDEIEARRLAAGAVVGAGMMVLRTGEEPESLKLKVCSKGGTTIAGVEKLTEMGFADAISAATDACFARSEELSR
ncbi:MAG: pyrroline-5-carboxylate reductase [Lachnospiraceae bacterium]|nr:pyrroline-5-carboxylate reductase [Lachnospiraceae bacterium]